MKNTKTPLLIVSLIAIVALAAAVFFGLKYSAAKKQLADAKKTSINVDAQAEVKQVIAQVGSLIILPTDEEPTLATVSDLAKLKDQPFFANAQIGDKVLIYSKARKAILYRPSTNKIIELAPLSPSTYSPAPANNAGQ